MIKEDNIIVTILLEDSKAFSLSNSSNQLITQQFSIQTLWHEKIISIKGRPEIAHRSPTDKNKNKKDRAALPNRYTPEKAKLRLVIY